jgi:hypothetical protein
VFQRSIGKLASGSIDNDHETNGHSPEYIQGKKSLFRGSHFVDLGSGNPSSETSGIFQSSGSIYARILCGYAPGL